MSEQARRKCHHCGQWFDPDCRNRRHQKYCPEPACRKVSKATSQQNWLNKPENRNYFKGQVHVRRVQEWRKAHPHQRGENTGKALTSPPLQDDCLGQHIENNIETSNIAPPVPSIPPLLQDFIEIQPLVLFGLIAHLTGSSLQDDIARTSHRFLQLGQDILLTAHADQGGRDERAAYSSTGPATPRADPFQLGRSPPGAG
ncbi:MAG: hypothetical protein G8345_13965 [Magnetococcales bacterium]|nr:hypothetical protein [Magnetococcales bacterium]